MAAINSVILEGRLFREVNAVSEKLRAFVLVIHRPIGTDENGEMLFSSTYFDVKCFYSYLFPRLDTICKGTKIIVQGSLHKDSWFDEEGVERSRISIYMEHISVIDEVKTPAQLAAANAQKAMAKNPDEPLNPFTPL